MTPEEIKKQATEITFDVERDKWDRGAVKGELNRANALVKAMETNVLRADRTMQQANTPIGQTNIASTASDFFQWAVGKTQRDKADIGLSKSRAQQGAMQGIASNLLTAKQEQDAVQSFGKKSKDLLKLTQRMDHVMELLSPYAIDSGDERAGQTPPGLAGIALAENGEAMVMSLVQDAVKGEAHIPGVVGVGGGKTGSTMIAQKVIGQRGDVFTQGDKEAQMIKSEVVGLINDLVREQSGASATDTERRKVAMSMGANEWSDPDTMLGNLGRLQSKLYERVQSVRSETHEQVIDTVTRRSPEGFSPVYDWEPTVYKFGASQNTPHRTLGQSNVEAMRDMQGAIQTAQEVTSSPPAIGRAAAGAVGDASDTVGGAVMGAWDHVKDAGSQTVQGLTEAAKRIQAQPQNRPPTDNDPQGALPKSMQGLPKTGRPPTAKEKEIQLRLAMAMQQEKKRQMQGQAPRGSMGGYA